MRASGFWALSPGHAALPTEFGSWRTCARGRGGGGCSKGQCIIHHASEQQRHSSVCTELHGRSLGMFARIAERRAHSMLSWTRFAVPLVLQTVPRGGRGGRGGLEGGFWEGRWGGGGLAQGLGIRLFGFGGAHLPLATAHSDPLWARTCFGCVNGAPLASIGQVWTRHLAPAAPASRPSSPSQFHDCACHSDSALQFLSLPSALNGRPLGRSPLGGGGGEDKLDLKAGKCSGETASPRGHRNALLKMAQG